MTLYLFEDLERASLLFESLRLPSMDFSSFEALSSLVEWKSDSIGLLLVKKELSCSEGVRLRMLDFYFWHSPIVMSSYKNELPCAASLASSSCYCSTLSKNHLIL